MATAIPDVGGGRLLTFLYDPAWVIMFDNPVLAWSVDETGAAPAQPVILGTMPPPAGDTAPIMSPQWAQFVDNMVFVPDVLRTSPAGLFTFLATNGGANRQLFSQFGDARLVGAWNEWAEANPALALADNPAGPPPGRSALAPLLSFTTLADQEPHRQVIPDGMMPPAAAVIVAAGEATVSGAADSLPGAGRSNATVTGGDAGRDRDTTKVETKGETHGQHASGSSKK